MATHTARNAPREAASKRRFNRAEVVMLTYLGSSMFSPPIKHCRTILSAGVIRAVVARANMLSSGPRSAATGELALVHREITATSTDVVRRKRQEPSTVNPKHMQTYIHSTQLGGGGSPVKIRSLQSSDPTVRNPSLDFLMSWQTILQGTR